MANVSRRGALLGALAAGGAVAAPGLGAAALEALSGLAAAPIAELHLSIPGVIGRQQALAIAQLVVQRNVVEGPIINGFRTFHGGDQLRA